MERKSSKTALIRSVPEPTSQSPPPTAVKSGSSSSTSATSSSSTSFTSSFSGEVAAQTTVTATSPISTNHESESNSDSDTIAEPPRLNPTPKSKKSPVVSDESESDSDITPESPKTASKSKPDNNKRDDKRTADDDEIDNTNPKRVKKDSTSQKPIGPGNKTVSVSGLTSSGKAERVLFQRLWSPEDEIAILKGLIDYKAEHGVDPMIGVEDFLVFMKKTLHVLDANKSQMVGKVRRLRKRFCTLSSKKKVTNTHDMKLLELSKMVWGDDGVAGEANKKLNVGVETTKQRVKKKVNVGLDVEVGFGFDEEGVMLLREAMKRTEGDEGKKFKTMVEESNVAYLKAFLIRLKVLEVAARKLLDRIKN